MQISWSVYPRNGIIITSAIVSQFPFPVFEQQPGYALFLSPVWDDNFQGNIYSYLNTSIIPNRIMFETAFNSSFDLKVEFLGTGEFEIDHVTMRYLAEMNCKLKINNCAP